MSARSVLRFAALICVLLLTASTAMACPVCDGGPDGINEVKNGIFNCQLLLRAAAVLAPFPVFAGIVVFIYFGPKGSPQREAGGYDKRI